LYFFRTSLGPVDLAFTDRYGGVSASPFDELNLAMDGDDDPTATAQNLRMVLDDFAPGDRLADLHQVHGDTVDVVEDRHSPDRPRADAVVTAQPGVVLVVRAADCVPVLFSAPDLGAVAAAHCGRPGLAAGVIPRTVDRLRAGGEVPVTAWIGPHVCGACYEVPAGMQAEIGAHEPASVATTSWGTPSLDLGAGVRAQLERAGVTVNDVSRCTRESADLYSYRRDGRGAGRIAGLIRRRPDGSAR
jgi:YfiH family protein